MKVLLTGADGYIGRGVASELVNSGHEVLGYGLGDALTIGSPLFSYVVGDAMSLSPSEIAEIAPGAVIHLAWRDGFRHTADSHIDDLPAHYRFVHACVEAGVPRLAVMGSMHEVGYHEGAVTADTPCWPTSPYAIAKNALRQLALSACEETSTQLLWMRGFYIVSADGRGNSIFAKLIAAASEGKKTFPFTSGRSQYDFMDYSEFCREVAELSINPSAKGVVNVCSGRPESLASRVERFIAENGLDIELEYGAFPDRPYDSPVIYGERRSNEGR